MENIDEGGWDNRQRHEHWARRIIGKGMNISAEAEAAYQQKL